MVRKRGEAPPIRLDRRLMEELMLGAGKVRRFTQDTPVMPDVWLAYAGCLEERRPVARGSEDEANPAVKLLFTPYRETAVGEVSVQLRARLDLPAQAAKRRQFGHRARVRPRVVYNQTTVAATLHFEDLVRAVLPMTQWWRDLEKKLRVARITEVIDPLALAIEDPEHPRPVPRKSGEPVRPSPGLLWMLRVVGALALQLRGESLP